MYYPLAQQEFESYLNGYDRENDRIKLKIIHTYGVVKQAEELAGRMHLSAEDTDLARLIALLHDIGRFEQLKRYDSFEPGTMDHAAYGVKVLFDEGMIRRFLPDDKWDSIIYTAIAHHSDYELPEISDPQTLLHAKLIRDEDKLDNGKYREPFFKTEWNPDLLLGMNYVCHFLTVRKSIMDKLELPDKEYDGSQDWHMTFRIGEQSRYVHHEPRGLYHWRVHSQSTAARADQKDYTLDSSRLSVETHFGAMRHQGQGR